MTSSDDPLDALREPLRPVPPDPAFAARLRDRLERLLLDPTLPIDRATEEAVMSDTTTRSRLRPGDLSYVAIWTPDVARAARFYSAVLGWGTDPSHDGTGRRITGVRTEMALYPQDTPTLFFAAVVDDVVAAAGRVRAAGGSAGEVEQAPPGLLVDCRDDQGLRFALHQPPEDAPPSAPGDGARPGELAYVAVQVPDTARAREFYGAVLGWEFRPGSEPRNWHVEVGGEPTRPAMVGLGEHAGDPVVRPMFAVDDIGAGCAAVRGAGGTAAEPEAAGYGVTAECTDDQGTRFWLARF